MLTLNKTLILAAGAALLFTVHPVLAETQALKQAGSTSNKEKLAQSSAAQKNIQQIDTIQKAEQARRIAEANRAVSNVMRASAAANAASLGQSAEVLQISEQARNQNQIMKNLESSRNTVPPVKKTEATEILRQERIRQSRETADRSRKALAAIEKNANIR